MHENLLSTKMSLLSSPSPSPLFKYKYTILKPNSLSKVMREDAELDSFLSALCQYTVEYGMTYRMVTEPSQAVIHSFGDYEDQFLCNSEYALIALSPATKECFTQFYARLVVFLSMKREWSNRFILLCMGNVTFADYMMLDFLVHDPVVFSHDNWLEDDVAWAELFDILKVRWKPYVEPAEEEEQQPQEQQEEHTLANHISLEFALGMEEKGETFTIPNTTGLARQTDTAPQNAQSWGHEAVQSSQTTAVLTPHVLLSGKQEFTETERADSSQSEWGVVAGSVDLSQAVVLVTAGESSQKDQSNETAAAAANELTAFSTDTAAPPIDSGDMLKSLKSKASNLFHRDSKKKKKKNDEEGHETLETLAKTSAELMANTVKKRKQQLGQKVEVSSEAHFEELGHLSSEFHNISSDFDISSFTETRKEFNALEESKVDGTISQDNVLLSLPRQEKDEADLQEEIDNLNAILDACETVEEDAQEEAELPSESCNYYQLPNANSATSSSDWIQEEREDRDGSTSVLQDNFSVLQVSFGMNESFKQYDLESVEVEIDESTRSQSTLNTISSEVLETSAETDTVQEVALQNTESISEFSQISSTSEPVALMIQSDVTTLEKKETLEVIASSTEASEISEITFNQTSEGSQTNTANLERKLDISEPAGEISICSTDNGEIIFQVDKTTSEFTETVDISHELDEQAGEVTDIIETNSELSTNNLAVTEAVEAEEEVVKHESVETNSAITLEITQTNTYSEEITNAAETVTESSSNIEDSLQTKSVFAEIASDPVEASVAEESIDVIVELTSETLRSPEQFDEATKEAQMGTQTLVTLSRTLENIETSDLSSADVVVSPEEIIQTASEIFEIAETDETTTEKVETYTNIAEVPDETQTTLEITEAAVNEAEASHAIGFTQETETTATVTKVFTDSVKVVERDETTIEITETFSETPCVTEITESNLEIADADIVQTTTGTLELTDSTEIASEVTDSNVTEEEPTQTVENTQITEATLTVTKAFTDSVEVVEKNETAVEIIETTEETPSVTEITESNLEIADSDIVQTTTGAQKLTDSTEMASEVTDSIVTEEEPTQTLEATHLVEATLTVTKVFTGFAEVSEKDETISEIVEIISQVPNITEISETTSEISESDILKTTTRTLEITETAETVKETDNTSVIEETISGTLEELHTVDITVVNIEAYTNRVVSETAESTAEIADTIYEISSVSDIAGITTLISESDFIVTASKTFENIAVDETSTDVQELTALNIETALETIKVTETFETTSESVEIYTNPAEFPDVSETVTEIQDSLITEKTSFQILQITENTEQPTSTVTKVYTNIAEDTEMGETTEQFNETTSYTATITETVITTSEISKSQLTNVISKTLEISEDIGETAEQLEDAAGMEETIISGSVVNLETAETTVFTTQAYSDTIVTTETKETIEEIVNDTITEDTRWNTVEVTETSEITSNILTSHTSTMKLKQVEEAVSKVLENGLQTEETVEAVITTSEVMEATSKIPNIIEPVENTVTDDIISENAQITMTIFEITSESSFPMEESSMETTRTNSVTETSEDMDISLEFIETEDTEVSETSETLRTTLEVIETIERNETSDLSLEVPQESAMDEEFSSSEHSEYSGDEESVTTMHYQNFKPDFHAELDENAKQQIQGIIQAMNDVEENWKDQIVLEEESQLNQSDSGSHSFKTTDCSFTNVPITLLRSDADQPEEEEEDLLSVTVNYLEQDTYNAETSRFIKDHPHETVEDRIRIECNLDNSLNQISIDLEKTPLQSIQENASPFNEGLGLDMVDRATRHLLTKNENEMTEERSKLILDALHQLDLDCQEDNKRGRLKSSSSTERDETVEVRFLHEDNGDKLIQVTRSTSWFSYIWSFFVRTRTSQEIVATRIKVEEEMAKEKAKKAAEKEKETEEVEPEEEQEEEEKREENTPQLSRIGSPYWSYEAIRRTPTSYTLWQFMVDFVLHRDPARNELPCRCCSQHHSGIVTEALETTDSTQLLLTENSPNLRDTNASVQCSIFCDMFAWPSQLLHWLRGIHLGRQPATNADDDPLGEMQPVGHHEVRRYRLLIIALLLLSTTLAPYYDTMGRRFYDFLLVLLQSIHSNDASSSSSSSSSRPADALLDAFLSSVNASNNQQCDAIAENVSTALSQADYLYIYQPAPDQP